MQPSLEHIPERDDVSFHYLDYSKPAFPFHWHLHPEYELTLITSGRGQRYVGDHMEDFREGDLVLLGENLPHTWHSHPASGRPSSSIVLQFRRDFLGPDLFDSREFQAAARLLDQSQFGVAFHGRTAREVGEQMIAMRKMSPVDRTTTLLRLLDRLSRCRTCRRLSSQAFTAPLRADDQRRIDKACRYIDKHHDQPITQAEVAEQLHMSPSAFSRFFKKNTGQTFVDYLHRLRIGRACRLLIETDQPITDICFTTGFGNLSNFNRIFQRHKQTTPRDYRSQFTASA